MTSLDGYLGAEGRITSGPAPALVATGYRWELGDAQRLHPGLNAADLAHVLELDDLGLLPPDARAALLSVLLEIDDAGPDAITYDERYGDAYNSRERWFEQGIGSHAGWLPTGRTRREAGRVAFRLLMIEELCRAAEQTARTGRTLASRAIELADAPFDDTTYLQPAQPSSLGHFLLGHAHALVRDAQRLAAAVPWFDRSPAGVGGVAGTRIPLDRDRLARRLGFAVVGAHARDIMWSIDGCVDAAVAATQVMTSCSRLAEDLEIFASPQFGVVDLDPSVCRASVLLPQKKNPYALSVIRAAASTAIGRATGLMATQRTPSARTDNWLLTYTHTHEAVDTACSVAALLQEVVATADVDVERTRATLGDGFTMATDLAELCVLHLGVDYRTAYRTVAGVAAEGMHEGRRRFTVDDVRAVARALGHADSPDELLDATRPESVLSRRGGAGSAVIAEVRVVARGLEGEVDSLLEHVDGRRARLAAARGELVAEARTRQS